MELTKEEKEFLLMPKALPSSSHYANLRKILSQSKWDKLRKMTYERASFQCELCSSKPKRLEAHELWFFDFEHKVQYLKRLVGLCLKCHSLQHALLLRLHHDQGFKNAQVVVNHYNKLTNNKLTFDQFFALANKEHNLYEKIEWNIVVITDFDEILKEL